MATKVIELESRKDIHGNEVRVGDTIVYCRYEGSKLYTMKVSRITAFTMTETIPYKNWNVYKECRTSNFIRITPKEDGEENAESS